MAEVAHHTEVDSTWIIIRGEVYDVTSWLELHPGGKLLLLAFAGRDATDYFDTVGHSPIAARELRRLHIGSVRHGPLEMEKAMSPTNVRKATLTGGRRASPSSSSLLEMNVSGSGGLWEVDEHGFLPCRDPVGIQALNGTAFEVFAELAPMLPSMTITGDLRRHLDGDPDLQARMSRCGDEGALEFMSEDLLERAFSVVGYIMVSYWRGATLDYSRGVGHGEDGDVSGGPCGSASTAPETLPSFIARPLLALSKGGRR